MSSGAPDSAAAPLRLIADIGGTNARFALLRSGAIRDEHVLACADFPNIVAAAEHYLAKVGAAAPRQRPVEAAVAIAGPVTGDLIRMTNHVWQFSAAATRSQLDLERLIFMNDFTALALAIRHLPAAELRPVGVGRAVAGAPMALIGPGTGLGVSGLIPVTGPEHLRWVPLQGEGGHVTLSVMTERELDILAVLRREWSHVSAERVLSGPGLVNLYEALCTIEKIAREPLTPKQITERALAGSCRLCLEAVNTFCALLGTLAGDLVLTLGALGGVYIGGGIVPRLGEMFIQSRFRDRFEDKGRYAGFLAEVPAYVINTRLPAFIGLAHSFTDPGPRLEAR
jgi:glucokinase